MLDIKNYVFNVMIKLGLKKRPDRVALRIKNSSNITLKNLTTTGYDKGIDAKNVKNFNVTDSNIKN